MTRRRAGRRATDYLSARHVNELQAAFEFTKRIGLPLSLFVTIAWIHTDALDDPDGRLLAALLERVRKMFLRQDITPAFLWVREWQHGKYGMSGHVHILIHVPVSFFQGDRLRDITKIFGDPYSFRARGCWTLDQSNSKHQGPASGPECRTRNDRK